MVKQNDNKVGAIKTLAGIDSLYYFIDTFDSELYHNFFNIIDSNPTCINNNNISYLTQGTSKNNGVIGRIYTLTHNDIDLAFVTFKSPDFQKNVKNVYVCLIADSIYTLGIKNSLLKVNDYLSSLFGLDDVNFDNLYPSRVDINTFIGGYDFSQARRECFSGFFVNSSSKNNEDYFDGNDLATLYLGSKKSKLSFKLYNKIKELKSHGIDKALSVEIKKAYFTSNGFNLDKPLWNAEFTLKREYLTQYGIDNMNDLFKFYKGLYFNIFNSLDYYGLNKYKIEKHRKNRNLHRLKVHPLWQKLQNYIAFEALEKEDLSFTDLPVKKVEKIAKDGRQKYLDYSLKKLVDYSIENGLKFNDEVLQMLASS